MYVFKGLTWIDINVVNLITMHVLIILPMFMFNISRYVQVNKYGDCWICYSPLIFASGFVKYYEQNFLNVKTCEILF